MSRPTSRLPRRLSSLDAPSLRGLRRGIEKEGLRVNPDGSLALTSHPARLGSALMHPAITTDFSESQLELITGVHPDIDACLQQLKETHQIVYQRIGDEVMWAASMPCSLPADDVIPIGRYGSSNVGRAKTVYRIGLKHRYGSRMQTISGLHYNFSLPADAWPLLKAADAHQGNDRDHRDESYFGLIRNFRRDSWLLLYLFGASPVVCSSFVAGRPHGLQPLNESTMYLPHATSLRMGPLGYQSNAQSNLGVSYNCLRSYAESLRDALTTPYPAYEAIGLRDESGQYRQLSTSLLQIENEFYGTIRPKQPVRSGERPLRALAGRGVDYVEVRLMDLDPFSPVGITAETIRFLDIFLLHCLLQDSPPDSPASIACLSRNRHAVAQRGREPGLQLEKDDGSRIALADWGSELLDACQPVAAALDAAHGGSAYAQVLERARELLAEPALTPSARVLEQVRGDDRASCSGFSLRQSLQHRQAFLAEPLAADVTARYEEMAAESLAAQRAAEEGDRLSFDEFRQQYISQPLVEDTPPTTRQAG